ncbi:MAG: hypothetical protein J5879_00140 [Clostridia bacterium]|nr:hypothetical protein [Clostridia bacterium]
MTAFVYYFLSFTWGLPVTLAGCAAALVMRIAGKRPERKGYCYVFRSGRGWGGFSLGIFVFAAEDLPEKTLWHEHGHGVQNCIFGPLMPFVVSIPSVVRYWIRRFKKDKSKLPPYESAWFESQATNMGNKQSGKIRFIGERRKRF